MNCRLQLKLKFVSEVNLVRESLITDTFGSDPGRVSAAANSHIRKTTYISELSLTQFFVCLLTCTAFSRIPANVDSYVFLNFRFAEHLRQHIKVMVIENGLRSQDFHILLNALICCGVMLS